MSNSYSCIGIPGANLSDSEYGSWDFQIEAEYDDGLVLLSNPQASYGGMEYLEYLRSEGIPYTGWSDGGEDYPPCLFAFDGEQYTEVPNTGSGSRFPSVDVNEDGKPEAYQLHAAREYWRIFKSATEKIHERCGVRARPDSISPKACSLKLNN